LASFFHVILTPVLPLCPNIGRTIYNVAGRGKLYNKYENIMQNLSLLSFGAVKEKKGDTGWNNGIIVKKPAGFENRGRSPAGITLGKGGSPKKGGVLFLVANQQAA
jgi:hypothetical protein